MVRIGAYFFSTDCSHEPGSSRQYHSISTRFPNNFHCRNKPARSYRRTAYTELNELCQGRNTYQEGTENVEWDEVWKGENATACSAAIFTLLVVILITPHLRLGRNTHHYVLPSFTYNIRSVSKCLCRSNWIMFFSFFLKLFSDQTSESCYW